MKQVFTLMCGVLLLLSSSAQNKNQKIDSLLNAYHQLYRFNGTALVAEKGVVLINKGYGYSNVAGNIANDENSIYQLGSISKQFTAALILKLQEEKKLNVADKISKYFPGYPKGDSISIEQLVAHTSGIYNYTDNRDFMENEVTIPKKKDEMIALFKDKPLNFSPGSKWSYSNSGYSLLGYIIEMASGTSYEQAVRKYLFTPANMQHSGFDFTHLENKNKTTGYFVVNEEDAPPAPIVDSTVSYAAGAIYSTTGDLYNWHRSLQNNTVLTKQQQNIAYTPIKNNYGYGWFTDSTGNKLRVSHGGGIHGYITNISRVPEDDICIVLLSNASDRYLNDITTAIYAVLYNKPYELPKKSEAVTLPPALMNEYVGEYEMRPGFIIRLSVEDNGLLAEVTNQGNKFILPEKEDLFFDTKDDVKLQFNRNEKKQVDGFTLMQGGRKTFCKKIK